MKYNDDQSKHGRLKRTACNMVIMLFVVMFMMSALSACQQTPDAPVVLSFDEIKNKFADYLNFVTHPDAESKFVVEKVELRSACSPAYDRPSNAWLIPVWVFEVKQHDITPEGKDVAFENIQFQFSALDGGSRNAKQVKFNS